MSAQRVIGVDLGGTKILAGAIDVDGRVLERHEVPTPIESQEALLEGIVAAIEPLAQQEFGALGFGIPSVLDRSTGRALGSINIPLTDVSLPDVLGERFGVPVAVENDANVAALAEWKLGAGRAVDSLVILTLGTGVGGGVVFNGELFRAWAELGPRRRRRGRAALPGHLSPAGAISRPCARERRRPSSGEALG